MVQWYFMTLISIREKENCRLSKEDSSYALQYTPPYPFIFWCSLVCLRKYTVMFLVKSWNIGQLRCHFFSLSVICHCYLSASVSQAGPKELLSSCWTFVVTKRAHGFTAEYSAGTSQTDVEMPSQQLWIQLTCCNHEKSAPSITRQILSVFPRPVQLAVLPVGAASGTAAGKSAQSCKCRWRQAVAVSRRS